MKRSHSDENYSTKDSDQETVESINRVFNPKMQNSKLSHEVKALIELRARVSKTLESLSNEEIIDLVLEVLPEQARQYYGTLCQNPPQTLLSKLPFESKIKRVINALNTVQLLQLDVLLDQYQQDNSSDYSP